MPEKERVVSTSTFSKAEDALIRSWLFEQYGVRFPRFAFWRLNPVQAIQKITEDAPGLKIKAGDLETVARRS
jgi:hypothetical protein